MVNTQRDGKQERQHAPGAWPGSYPAMHTGLKHFTPLQLEGAAAASGALYGLGPFIAVWRSSATAASSAKQVGQHWPLARVSTKGGTHLMSAHPVIKPQAAPLSCPWSTSAPPWRMSSACSEAGMSLP